jgi:2'-5' RNA ligase
MDGIVSLLDATHETTVVEIWSDLQREFGLHGLPGERYPHVSYHVAQSYDATALERALPPVMRKAAPFRMRTTGLGIFTAAQPVLFVPVVRGPELAQLHAALWAAATPTAAGLVEVYGAETWVPHITLAYGDLNMAQLPDVVRFLNGRDFDWEIPVDSIFVVAGAGSEGERRMRFPFLGV